MKLALALLLLCGAASVLAAPGEGNAPSAGGNEMTNVVATPAPLPQPANPGSAALPAAPTDSKSPEISKSFKDLSNDMTDVSNKVTQLSGGMNTAATQLKKIGEVHNMLKEAARRRKLRWREKYGNKPSKFSGRDGESEDKFGQWKDRQFPETGVPAPKDGDNGVDTTAALGSDAVDKKMLADVLAKAKEVSPLADSVNDSLKNDLAQMAASLGGYDAHVKKINRKLDSAVSAARKKALKEQAMEKLHSAMSQSRLKIKELHERAKQLAAVERTHKKNLRKKLKRLAQLHRQHVQKLIYRSRLQAMKLWLQHNRRKKLARMMNQLKITQMYQQHKIDTQKAMSKSAKKLWKSFIGALQGHKGLRDESRKATEAIERLNKRRMNKLKQEHQRKKAQIKRYVQQKYAAIMKSHFNRINDIRRKRQETLKVLSEEVNRNREQKRRMERIVTDQESPSDQPEWETQLRERAARTRRLNKLYKAIQQQKKLRLTKMKIEKRLKEAEEKQGDYFVDLRKKLNEKLTKLTEVIESNQAKIDEAIQFERKEWRNRMATNHLQKKVAELSNTITELKAGSHKDLPDAIRQGLEKEMAAQHHEKLRNERRAKRIAAADELKEKTPAFVEEDDSTTLSAVGEEDENALAEHDDTMEDEDAFAADMPALMRELKSMRSSASPSAAGLAKAPAKKAKGGASKNKKKKKAGKKSKKKRKGKKKNKRRKGKRKNRKGKRKNRKGKRRGGKKSKKGKKAAKPKKTRFAAQEASEGADDESEAVESEEEEEAEDATENAESAEASGPVDDESSEATGPVDDQSEVIKGDDLKVWKAFQATPDASAPKAEEESAAKSKAQAVADAALSEASENDDDLMKEKPTPVKKAEAPRAPTRFAAPSTVASAPQAPATVDRPADELVGICFKEVIEAKQQSAATAQPLQQPQAPKPLAQPAPVAQAAAPAPQIHSAPRLRQVNRAVDKEAGFDFSELIAETEPTVDLKHLLDGVLLETESHSSDPNQYCVNILRSYRQWRLSSVCGGDTACAAQCPSSVCKVPPGVSIDKPRAPDAPKDVPPTWNYGQGGKDWNSGLCQSGLFQSPIMIEENRLNFTTNAREVRGNPFRVRTRYSPVMNLTLSHTNRYTVAILPQVQGSMGHALSGVDETSYHVTGLFFRAPSEHTFSSRVNSDNKRGDFPLELQIVHQKADGNGTLIFVVEFELKHTPGDNGFLASLGWRDLPRGVDQHRVIGTTVNLNDLSYSLDSDFYAYSGSSSTPDCAENVEYRVFTTPQGLTRAQLDTLTSLYTNSAEFPNGHGNNREIQPRNSRSIVKFIRHVFYNEDTQRTEKRQNYQRTVQWVTATTQ